MKTGAAVTTPVTGEEGRYFVTHAQDRFQPASPLAGSAVTITLVGVTMSVRSRNATRSRPTSLVAVSVASSSSRMLSWLVTPAASSAAWSRSLWLTGTDLALR